jgi:nitroreductase
MDTIQTILNRHSVRKFADQHITDDQLNTILAAEALGLGSVWLGTYPQIERVAAQQQCFGLPEHIVPHSLIAIGYPDTSEPQRPKKPIPDCIHYEKW